MDLIINFAPTGIVPTKAVTPFVPLSVAEIVENVHRAVEIGITMVHLHARDEATGKPTYKAELYGRIITGIRAFAPELIICVSLSGRTFNQFDQRAEPLRLDGAAKPDMGSLTLSSLNFNRDASVNAPDMVQALAQEMNERQIMPELEAFDVGMINYAKYLSTKGALRPPYYFNLLFGNVACAQADLLHAGTMVRDLPEGALWSMAGLGNAQLMMNSIAIASGGGVRVGLEDNIWFDQGRTQLASNSQLLIRIHELAEANERKIMSAPQLRQLLHLQRTKGVYGRLDD